ncbi:Uncharacterized protein Fot_13874 [Forsythia ovata]|uniref:Uncharacterized protein n=1 Tax=Forsythia ovata TaxID=205694 RepID=A0ABD1W554_9LAMI
METKYLRNLNKRVHKLETTGTRDQITFPEDPEKTEDEQSLSAIQKGCNPGMRTTMAGWHCSSQNTSPSKLSYFFDKPILACVLQGKHIHQSDILEKCQAPSLSTICHSSLA